MGKVLRFVSAFRLRVRKATEGEGGWQKMKGVRNRNLIKSLRMPSFDMLVPRHSRAVKATLDELRSSG